MNTATNKATETTPAQYLADERAARWERATGPARRHIERMREIADAAAPTTYTVSPLVPFDPYL